VVDVLDADVATEKRAQWEAFEFITLGDGDVEVVNDRRNERGWSAPSGIRTLVLAVRGHVSSDEPSPLTITIPPKFGAI
jgi:hypothetical protein